MLNMALLHGIYTVNPRLAQLAKVSSASCKIERSVGVMLSPEILLAGRSSPHPQLSRNIMQHIEVPAATAHAKFTFYDNGDSWDIVSTSYTSIDNPNLPIHTGHQAHLPALKTLSMPKGDIDRWAALLYINNKDISRFSRESLDLIRQVVKTDEALLTIAKRRDDLGIS
jgi:hypothetical protein